MRRKRTIRQSVVDLHPFIRAVVYGVHAKYIEYDEEIPEKPRISKEKIGLNTNGLKSRGLNKRRKF